MNYQTIRSTPARHRGKFALLQGRSFIAGLNYKGLFDINFNLIRHFPVDEENHFNITTTGEASWYADIALIETNVIRTGTGKAYL